MSFDFAAVKKIQLVDMVRAAQEATGSVMSAASTLLRMKPDALVDKIGVICGSTHEVDESGTVVQVSTGDTGVSSYIDPATGEDAQTIDYTETDTVEKIDEEAEAEASAANEPVVEPKTSTGDERVITVVTSDKTFRDGSDRAAYFAVLKSGQTVAEYLVASASVGPKGRRVIRKAVSKGLITLTTPSTTEG